MEKEKRLEIYRAARKQWGFPCQVMKAIEECSEFIQAASKCFFDATEGNKAHLAEEIADAEIMLEQMKIMLSLEESVDLFKAAKLIRLKERLKLD